MHNGNNAPAIAVNNLNSGYPGRPDVIRDISFEVAPGERVGVLGPNGAGKSTLLKSIIGLLPVRSGEICIHGHSTRERDVRVGYVPQHEQIDWNFPATVRDVVMMGRTREIGWFRRASRADWAIVDESLARVGMARFADRQIGQLSGGQRRRVFIARSLAQNTDVILLDEPFSGVDKAAEREIMDVLDRLQDEGVTMLLATHDMQMALHHFDRLLMINERIIAYADANLCFTPDILTKTFGGQVGIFTHAGEDVIIMRDCCP